MSSQHPSSSFVLHLSGFFVILKLMIASEVFTLSSPIKCDPLILLVGSSKGEAARHLLPTVPQTPWL